MITYVVCSIFESPARVMVNTVNTVGVMGKGIARDFKQIYPDMFREYQKLCESGSLRIGSLWLYKTSNKWVLNFPTKRHWRQPSRPEYIEAGLKKFAEVYHVHSITSISFPLLGCGNGELDWETQVQPLMEKYLRDLPITAFVHLHDRKDTFSPEHLDVRSTRDWLRGEPTTLAFTEVWEDICRRLDTPKRFAMFGSGKTFEVEVYGDDEGLSIAPMGRAQHIPEEAFLELWQYLRQTGFVGGACLPYGLNSWSEYVLPIMAELPYVKPVVMADEYSKVTQEAVGLRLWPELRPTDLPLFAMDGAINRE